MGVCIDVPQGVAGSGHARSVVRQPGLTPRFEMRTVAIGDLQRRAIFLLLTSEQ
jgi:hypothetical protein